MTKILLSSITHKWVTDKIVSDIITKLRLLF
ncbi:hypothetical protein BN1321_220020 [Staphylococcus aureus]|uniref:Uncharacterized protein n=1 Tax=Staphylococcus aureus TaxID=1280 RepID=A0A0U1MHT1_STAAU|nr:hypothetical protein BN1321_220020 [Staphylococcus aureus]